MGLRFLGVEEVLEEIFPGMMTSVRERDESPAIGEAAPPLGVAAPAQPATQPPTPLSPPPADRLFRMTFHSREQFRRVFESDIATGGLFVPAAHPPALDTVVVVEVSIEHADLPPVQVEGRVVHRLEAPPDEEAEPSLLTGMGLQFTDISAAIERLRPLLES